MKARWIPAAILAAALIPGCKSDKERLSSPPPAPPPGTNAPKVESSSTASTEPDTSGPAKVDESKYKTTPSGLKYAVLKPGTGKKAKSGDPVRVHYTGWLKDGGKKFDSSRDRGEPLPFTIGAHRVIPGWEEGIEGMQEGEQRQLVIPAALGYGDTGFPPDIPAGATLVFDVELVKIGS